MRIRFANSCLTWTIFVVFYIEANYAEIVQSTGKKSGSIVDIIRNPVKPNENLDLAFIMDSTGSMGSYIQTAKTKIQEIVNEIVKTSGSNVKLALIKYRDHTPLDKTFVTRRHDFTSSVSQMKSWLDKTEAAGGGDVPEAVAEAMFDTTKLTWRPKSTKIAVMISDAPPHGLVPSEDLSFPQGSPNGHDPITIARDLTQMGVTLYVIGCEPAIIYYKDFFEALAYITGGQYVPLTEPHLLVNAITGGAREELSLKKFEGLVQAEISQASAGGNGAPINEESIASNVFRRLKQTGARTEQLVRNNKILDGPSEEAKKLAVLKSLAEVRKVFKKRAGPRRGLVMRRGGPPGAGLGDSLFSRMAGVSGSGGSLRGSKGFMDTPSVDFSGDLSSSSMDTISTIKSGITMKQVRRLVRKGTSKVTI